MMGKAERRAYGLARRHHNNAIVLIAAIDAFEDGEITEERLEELTKLIELHPRAWRYQDSPDFMTLAYDEEARRSFCRVLANSDRIMGHKL